MAADPDGATVGCLAYGVLSQIADEDADQFGITAEFGGQGLEITADEVTAGYLLEMVGDTLDQVFEAGRTWVPGWWKRLVGYGPDKCP